MLKAIKLPPSNYLITYYQYLDEVTWILQKHTKNLKKLEQNCQFYQKIS